MPGRSAPRSPVGALWGCCGAVPRSGVVGVGRSVPPSPAGAFRSRRAVPSGGVGAPSPGAAGLTPPLREATAPESIGPVSAGGDWSVRSANSPGGGGSSGPRRPGCSADGCSSVEERASHGGGPSEVCGSSRRVCGPGAVGDGPLCGAGDSGRGGRRVAWSGPASHGGGPSRSSSGAERSTGAGPTPVDACGGASGSGGGGGRSGRAGCSRTVRSFGTEGPVCAGADDVGAGDVGAGDVGADDVGADDVGADDVGADDVGADDVGADDVGADEVGTADASASADRPSGWKPGAGGRGFRVGRFCAGPSLRGGGPACCGSSWRGAGSGWRHHESCGASDSRIIESGARPCVISGGGPSRSSVGCSSFLSRRQPLPLRFSWRAFGAASGRSPSAPRFLKRPRRRLDPSSIGSSAGRFCTGAS